MKQGKKCHGTNEENEYKYSIAVICIELKSGSTCDEVTRLHLPVLAKRKKHTQLGWHLLFPLQSDARWIPVVLHRQEQIIR